MAEHLMVPQENWLGTTQATMVNTGDVLHCDVPQWSSSWYQPSWWPYYCPVYTSTPARPIRLTIAEVMRLRFMAQEHPDLKAILQKFTAQIEIVVEF